MPLLIYLLLFLLVLFTFRRTLAKRCRILTVIIPSLIGAFLFAGLIAHEMGGIWIVLAFLVAFFAFVQSFRELIDKTFPPRNQDNPP